MANPARHAGEAATNAEIRGGPPYVWHTRARVLLENGSRVSDVLAGDGRAIHGAASALLAETATP
jgi:hypothetical protein